MFVQCETHKMSPMYKLSGPPIQALPVHSQVRPQEPPHMLHEEDQQMPQNSAAPLQGPPSSPALWRPFEDRQVDECIQNISCQGDCQHVNCNRTQNGGQKVIRHDCKLEFNDKITMMDHKRDSDHPSKRKCNQPDCQRQRCWYVHKPLLSSQTQGVNHQEEHRFMCKTCQNSFSDKNEMMHHRKREHPSNIMCKYFLSNKCRRRKR